MQEIEKKAFKDCWVALDGDQTDGMNLQRRDLKTK